MPYAPIIGLEIHVQLKTASKMFCSCANVNDGEAEPNTAICPVCTGHPGALPALNRQALEYAVLAGLALHCRIPDRAKFDRKNYFYPDLPKGYQISQFNLPVCAEGTFDFDVADQDPPRNRVRVGITRAHLEEDAAKNMHTPDGKSTLVDYNRGGTPLLEIVTEPDFKSPAEAKAFLQELRLLLRRIGVSDADMEKGQMRCDANVSIIPIGQDGLPTQETLNPKIEVKNVNSFRAVERALAYEIERQTDLYESNTPPVTGATRGWDENKGATVEQRTKEGAADYRYFPEPDLPPVDLVALREKMRSRLPELPDATRRRIMDEWGFSESDARFLISNEGWADYAEQVMGELGGWIEASDDQTKSGGDIVQERKAKLAKLTGGWLTSKLAGLLAERNKTIKDLKLSAEDFAEFIHLLLAGEINSANGLRLLALMAETGRDPSQLMEEHNLGQNMSDADLEREVRRIVDANPKQADELRAGKQNVLMWFVGGVMKATEGRANPEKAKELVKKVIGV
ncbi:glutaminyl-tRNA synthase (glutamine-hydrolyzing) subunit B [Candidatus Uhrbacteria bacterium RIFCSPHIGHO2_12_FULL_60_25]|uniref:Aspartyl/glutamyl-tRNA(Asn/Gln) amidotransferase subunit B n=1 Tax=Candidatus Uhrbacteria bacterium RIFCSPHIGHO2_12_FULL_60_25 TaxID=1802399 RepID=A0A1F7UPJ1_9BACT|nr:MAG: glutaminyl-tRNA synthase (glutamine-hydrolyzing) subunit B [Candidatus Uhrbacteria bacterium RIFCSPHIGHO2_02_FULL_60_44]OGL79664.1 MAG: glutaminyl-tRNA synthase (glutamine-hydrolyzing) subunit B [Candidatus Uhrbacteria bacterium RIFCSPHIGHO2_12_FULL_60_25]